MNPLAKGFFFVIEAISHFARLISLSVRLFANIFAGHLLLLFMGGGLAVLLGVAALGLLTLPLAFAFFLLELGPDRHASGLHLLDLDSDLSRRRDGRRALILNLKTVKNAKTHTVCMSTQRSTQWT